MILWDRIWNNKPHPLKTQVSWEFLKVQNDALLATNISNNPVYVVTGPYVELLGPMDQRNQRVKPLSSG